jgi:PAS domain S-box-containing protein
MANQTDLDFQLNENIFRTLIEESSTPVALYVGAEMKIKVANRAIIKAYGKDEDVIDKLLFELMPELKTQTIYGILNNVYETGIAHEENEALIQVVINGEQQAFYYNYSFKPLKDSKGNIWGVLNTASDVTELVLTRTQLKESEERIQFTLQAAELGTWDLYPPKQIVIWDDRCKELCGYQKTDEIPYADILKYIHPDDEPRLQQAVQNAFNPETGGNYDITVRAIDEVGKIKYWIRCRGKAYFNEHSELWRFSGTVQDVTRELQDKQEQQKLIALIENTDEIIAVGGMDAAVSYINKAGYALLGADNEAEALRQGIDYFYGNDKDRVNKEIIPAIQQNGVWNGEILYRHFITNEPIPVHLNAFRIDDPLTGQPMGMASVARDLRPEKAAHNEQYKLLTLIDHSSDFVSLSDLDGNVSYVNAAGLLMLGIKSLDELQVHSSQYIMPDQLAKLNNRINKAMQKDGKWSGETSYRHFETGEAIPVYGTTMLVYDAVSGKPQGQATIARDLRREIADKKALTDSEHLLKSITNASPTALWMSDYTGIIIYVNQTWIEWTGLPYEEHLGTSWINTIFPEDRLRASEKFSKDLASRSPYEIDFRLIRKDGTIRWCVANGNPQFNQEGVFIGYIGSCTDVTDKTIAEMQLIVKNQELIDQIKEFEFVTNFVPVQLWTAQTNGHLDYVNKTAVDFFGMSPREVIGPEWFTRVHPEDQPGCTAAWTNALQTGEVYQFEFRLKDKNGIYKWHLARALPFIIDDKVIKWFGTNTDIDEQKQLQRQKDDFLGIASHELKTPVTSIKAYAQVLGAMLTKEGEYKKAEMVTRMDAQVNRLTNLIGDLLDVTKINSGKLQFNKTFFNFNEAIHETIDDLQHTTQKHSLIKDFTETGNIYADKDRISQVITNLITNAIKYSPHTDEIIISTRLENNEVIVCVQDFGIGIPADKKDMVFEQFYRVSGNKQHTFPGLGLGLYISSEIIKREGGRMWVNSIEGSGSTFCFALPVGNNNIDLLIS